MRDLQQAQKRNSYFFSSCCIASYAEIVKATVQKLQEQGLRPFLFPAMGSHGSSSEGQKKVLEHYGVTEKDMGVPIQSSLEVVQIGETEDKVPVYVDELASRADHIVLINRVKPHTEFEAEHAKIPLILDNDHDAIHAAIGNTGLIPAEQLKIIRIKNTANLGVVDVSDAYRSELSKRPDLELIDGSRPLAFDVNWNLTPFQNSKE
jgi:hypothetical protein